MERTKRLKANDLYSIPEDVQYKMLLGGFSGRMIDISKEITVLNDAIAKNNLTDIESSWEHIRFLMQQADQYLQALKETNQTK